MPRQNADHPIRARRHDHVNSVLGEHFAFRGNDLDTQRHQVLSPFQHSSNERQGITRGA